MRQNKNRNQTQVLRFIFRNCNILFYENIKTYYILIFLTSSLSLLLLEYLGKTIAKIPLSFCAPPPVELDQYIGWPIYLADTNTNISVSINWISVSASVSANMDIGYIGIGKISVKKHGY